MNQYKGKRDPKDELDNDVWVEDALGARAALLPRFDLRNHSPTGFEWGYGGSGPAQLALAICAHVLQDDARALRVYQDFKRRVVGTLARPGWELTENFVRSQIAEVEHELKKDGAGWIVILQPQRPPVMTEHASAEVKLADLYRYAECEIVDRVLLHVAGKEFDCWVDDEGLLNDAVKPNRIVDNGSTICGTIAICASTPAGDSRPLTGPEAELVMAHVKHWKVCPEGARKPEATFTFIPL